MSYIAPFISFFTIISVVLFGSHVFLYFAIRHFFSPGDVARRNIAIVLGLLSVSFIVASTVAHWYDTIFSRGLYYGSAVWLGVLSNAFFVFAILWVLGGILSLARFPLAPLKMGWTGIVIIILSSLYGLSNAADPVVREETVYIRNLPAEWEGKKIVQITDVHLGHIVRSDFARRIVDMSNAVRPAAIFIVGDLLDGMDGHLDGLVEPFNDLRSQYGTYFVTGNHETYLGTGETMDAIRRTNIRTLDDAMADLGGVQLVGIAFPERWQQRDIAMVLKKLGLDRTKPSIVLYHSPTETDVFRSFGVSLQLAGHTHRGQLYPYNLLTNLIFHGYDFWIHREGEYTLSVSSGAGTWWPPIRTDSRAEIVVLTLKDKQ